MSAELVRTISTHLSTSLIKALKPINVAFAPNNTIVTGALFAGERQLARYNIATRSVQTIYARPYQSIDFHFTPSSEIDIEAACYKKTVHFTQSKTTHVILEHPGNVRFAVISPDGALLATACSITTGRDKDDNYIYESTLRLYSILMPALSPWEGVVPGFIEAIAFAPSLNLLAFATEKMLYTISPLSKTKTVKKIPLRYVEKYSSLAFSPDGKFIALGTRSAVVLCSIGTKGGIKIKYYIRLYAYTGQHDSSPAISFSPDCKSIVISTHTKLFIIDVETGDETWSQDARMLFNETCIKFAPSANIFAVTSYTGNPHSISSAFQIYNFTPTTKQTKPKPQPKPPSPKPPSPKPQSPKPPSPKPESTSSEKRNMKSCEPGHERNPKTNRCNKKCANGTSRDLASWKCYKPCPSHLHRSLSTGRCVK